MNRLVLSALELRQAVPLLAALAMAPGCGSSGGTTNGTHDASANGGGVDDASDGSSKETDAKGSHDASREAMGGCAGTAPNCFGNDLASCCGQDPSGPATCSGGEWMCGTAVAPGCNGESCSAPEDGGGPCPATLPADGTACSISQLACEYGTDPALECDTVVTCAGGAWTTTQTPFAGGFCTTTSAPACPASVADVSQGSTCGGAFLQCDYPDARCECACPEGNPGGDCSTDASLGPRIWQCDTSSDASPDCPATRPRLGASCSQENESCSYAGKDQLACWGDALECKGGVWVNAGGAGC
jgi:hypothetical protein